VTLTQAGSFASKDVGSGIAVTAADILGGAGASNYTLTQPTGLAANITPATFIAGQTPSGLSGTLSGFLATDNQVNATAGTLILTTTAGASSRPGVHGIDGRGLTATNYVFVESMSDATALTLQPAVAPVTPPVAAADTAILVQAQNAAATLEANLPYSQTDSQPGLLDVSQRILATQSSDTASEDFATAAINSDTQEKRREVFDARAPTLRIVRGGVKLPDNAVDIHAR
jgi:hypothetical protein